MKVLVTGDRHWDDHPLLIQTLDDIHAETPIDLIVEGCAPGADTMAGDHPPLFDLTERIMRDPGWAWVRRVPTDHNPITEADWARFKKGAGPKRNQRMLDKHPDIDLVVAFHHDLSKSRGTADMVRRARKAGIPVKEIN